MRGYAILVKQGVGGYAAPSRSTRSARCTSSAERPRRRLLWTQSRSGGVVGVLERVQAIAGSHAVGVGRGRGIAMKPCPSCRAQLRDDDVGCKYGHGYVAAAATPVGAARTKACPMCAERDPPRRPQVQALRLDARRVESEGDRCHADAFAESHGNIKGRKAGRDHRRRLSRDRRRDPVRVRRGCNAHAGTAGRRTGSRPVRDDGRRVRGREFSLGATLSRCCGGPTHGYGDHFPGQASERPYRKTSTSLAI